MRAVKMILGTTSNNYHERLAELGMETLEESVRPKKGPYTPTIRDRNPIQRIPTTGLWGSYAKVVSFTKQKTYV